MGNNFSFQMILSAPLIINQYSLNTTLRQKIQLLVESNLIILQGSGFS